MTLLMITRKVDKQDSNAGFIYEWVKRIAESVDKLIVICQELGDSSGLPSNIKIYSFGKEKARSRLGQLISFKLLLFKKIPQVDGVFVHMMPIYSIVAGPFCKIFGKRLIQWYTHKVVDFKLKLANLFVDKFATASKESFRLKTKKPVEVLGHGIDVEKFISKPKTQLTEPKDGFNIISVGRISPSKDYESMIKVVYELKRQDIQNVKLKIIGGISLAREQSYLDSLQQMVEKMDLKKEVEFLGPIPFAQVNEYFQKSDLFINLSSTGSLDKTVLEAMASGCLPLTSNEAFKNILPAELIATQDNPAKLAQEIKAVISLTQDKKERLRQQLRQEIVEHHNLDKLVKKIVGLYK